MGNRCVLERARRTTGYCLEIIKKQKKTSEANGSLLCVVLPGDWSSQWPRCPAKKNFMAQIFSRPQSRGSATITCEKSVLAECKSNPNEPIRKLVDC